MRKELLHQYVNVGVRLFFRYKPKKKVVAKTEIIK